MMKQAQVISMVFIHVVLNFASGSDRHRHRLTGMSGIVTVFKDLGPQMCKNMCTKYSDCKYINYKRNGGYCELRNDLSGGEIIADDDFLFSEKSYWTVDNNLCWPNPCSSGQKCVIVNKSKFICIKTSEYLTDNEKSILYQFRGLDNIALGKNATMNPNASPSSESAGASVDGDLTTHSKTSNYKKADGELYWMVDLGGDFLVQRVEIFNRQDCCGSRLADIDILIGMASDPTTLCGHYVGPGANGEHIVINCPETILGRYVKLNMKNPKSSNYLHPAEVLVYAFN